MMDWIIHTGIDGILVVPVLGLLGFLWKYISSRHEIELFTDLYFLGMSAKEGKNIYVGSFQIRGRNNSKKPFEKISGYLISGVNNERLPILLDSMPLEKTKGITPDSEFWIRVLIPSIPNSDREGLPAEDFLKKFSPSILVFEYADKMLELRFTRLDFKLQIDSFWNDSNPDPKLKSKPKGLTLPSLSTKRRGMPFVIGGALCLLAIVAFVVFRIMTPAVEDEVSISNDGYFLGMSAKEGKNIYVSSLQLKGANKSNKRFERVSGYLVSNISNEKLPVLLDSMPPEKTRGIPPKCEFSIKVLFPGKPNSEREGLPAEDFL